MFTDEDFHAANERYLERLRSEPHIVKAHYDAALGRFIVSLSNNAWFAFCPQDAQGLETASPADLERIEISPMKYGLHFPAVDAHFDITALMQGSFGTRRWMEERSQQLSRAAQAEADQVPAVKPDIARAG